MSAYTFHQGDLLKLDLTVDRGTDIVAWHIQWESYCFLSGLANEDMAKQVKALKLCLSRETLSIIYNLGLSKAQISAIIDALQKYVDGHVNEAMERCNIRHQFQQNGESFDNYLISLTALGLICDGVKLSRWCPRMSTIAWPAADISAPEFGNTVSAVVPDEDDIRTVIVGAGSTLCISCYVV